MNLSAEQIEKMEALDLHHPICELVGLKRDESGGHWIDERNVYRYPSQDTHDAISCIGKWWDGDYEIRRRNDIFRATLYQPSHEWMAWGKTLAVAMSRAALLASLALRGPMLDGRGG